MAPSAESIVTLFTHKYSPYAQRVQLAMVEKGISFKPIYVDLANKPTELLEANPVYGKVPALVHDGNSVCESLVILEYLDEAWPETKSLLPKDPVARGKSRFWADFMYKGLTGIVKLTTVKPETPEAEAAILEASKFLKTVEKTMTEYSAEGPFFTGNESGYLDIILSPLACWGAVMKTLLNAPLPGPDQLPRINKWVAAMKERKAYKEVVPADEVVLEAFTYVTKKREAAAAASNGKVSLQVF